MDSTEWIPHTTKSGKILYYINPVTGQCKWQRQLSKEDNQNACSSDVHSTQLGKTSKQDVPRVVSSGLLPNVPAPHITQTKLHSASNDVIANSSKDERQDKKEFEGGEELLNHQENLVTVDIFADCKTAHIHCVQSGEVDTTQSENDNLGNIQMSNGLSKERLLQQQILQCPQCNELFSCPHKFTSHLRSHPELDPLKCPVCTKEYSSSASLSTHLRTHTGEKPFECSHCQKCFSQSSHLTTHMRVHTGEKPYHCPKCPKTFGQSSHLTLHLRIHNGEKPFQCRFCTKVFSHSSALSTHMRTHTGEKPFQCPHCPKKFGQSSHLKIHVRTHTGERPFQCPHCQKCFRQSCYLAKHVRGHSSIKQNDIPKS